MRSIGLQKRDGSGLGQCHREVDIAKHVPSYDIIYFSHHYLSSIYKQGNCSIERFMTYPRLYKLVSNGSRTKTQALCFFLLLCIF